MRAEEKRIGQFWIAMLIMGVIGGGLPGELSARTTKLAGTPVAKLKEKAGNGTTTVLVRLRLDAPFVAEGKLTGGDRAKQQEKIRRAQEKAIRKHTRLKAGEEAFFKSIPHMILRVNADLIDALADDDDIERIDEELEFSLILADSTAQIDAPFLWNSSYTGSGYSVAILDTGVQSNHPFLSGKVVHEACFSRNLTGYWASTCTGGTVDSAGLATWTDATGAAQPCTASGDYVEYCDHGTAVAGVAAGKNGSLNGISFHGVAKDANIVAVKVFTLHTKTSGNEPVGLEGDIIRALLYVNTSAVRVSENVAAVNLSIATDRKTAATIAERTSNCGSVGEDGSTQGLSASALVDAVANLRSNGVVVVGGTGNDRDPVVHYPGCAPNILVVGGVTKNDTVWSDSSTVGSNSSEAMDMWAPATGYSSGGSGPGATGIVTSFPGTPSYKATKGTSIAVPHVAGAVAVLKQASPTSSATDIINALRSSGPLVTDSMNNVTRPRLDLRRAYFRLTDTTAPSAPAMSSRSTGPTSVEISWSGASDAQSGIDYYVIQRRTAYNSNGEAGWTELSTHPTSSPYVDTVSSNTVYQYRVKAVNLAGLPAASNMDLATTKVFSTDLKILGQHIIDLRETINLICDFAGTSVCASHPYPGTPADQLNALKAEPNINYLRFRELQNRIDTLRSAIQVPAASWASPLPAVGERIWLRYLDELRSGVN